MAPREVKECDIDLMNKLLDMQQKLRLIYTMYINEKNKRIIAEKECGRLIIENVRLSMSQSNYIES